MVLVYNFSYYFSFDLMLFIVPFILNVSFCIVYISSWYQIRICDLFSDSNLYFITICNVLFLQTCYSLFLKKNPRGLSLCSSELEGLSDDYVIDHRWKFSKIFKQNVFCTELTTSTICLRLEVRKKLSKLMER